MGRFAIARWLPNPRAVAGLGGILIAWAAVSAAGLVGPTFLPSPLSVLKALARLLQDHSLLYDVGASVYRVQAGFILAGLLAVPLGLLIGSTARFRAYAEPVVGFFRYLPVPSLVPLCILWIGIGNAEKVAVIFLGTFFQLTSLVADATRAVPTNYTDLAATLGLSRAQRLSHVILPASAPGIYNALRVSMGWAWSYLVVAELVAAASGLGHVIIESQRYLQTAEVFAAILVIGLIGVAYDAFFGALHGVFFPWVARKS